MKEHIYLLGLDIGSSSVKAALVDADTGEAVRTAQAPEKEMAINSPKPGWAEQDPESWWKYAVESINKLIPDSADKGRVKAIGISYQMHGLVIYDKNKNILRPSIIWCDSRAAETGDKAFKELGYDRCMESLLNSPGNFTASKLAWVRANEPGLFEKADKFSLPGDYIAYRLTGDLCTTVSGLSEGIFWNFRKHEVSSELLRYYGLDKSLLPEIAPTFGQQGTISSGASAETGLPAGIPVSYRAGDQPNNALSLNVFNPGELAATAGTSGVVYGILDQLNPDTQSRVNLFAHVNHSKEQARLGVLLCINGTGILYNWLRNQFFGGQTDYSKMNSLASGIEAGSGGLNIYPFGNGVERVLNNRHFGGRFTNIDFNRHSRAHIIRAAQEGIVYALNYGFEAMKELGVKTTTVRAGAANMFQSKLFASLFSTLTGTEVELYNTDGAIGAARGAGIGAGYFKNPDEAFANLKTVDRISPDNKSAGIYKELYNNWKQELQRFKSIE